MLKKTLNLILILIFAILLVLFIYKTIRKPQMVRTNNTVTNIITTEQEGVVENPNIQNIPQEELQAAIKEYIINNPEEILGALENVQKQKTQTSIKKVQDYLAKNKEFIETIGYPPVIGNPEGDISIVMFYDYNCSYCTKANEYINNIIDIDPNVKLILRPTPILGGTSAYATKLALAVNKLAPEEFSDIHNEMLKMPLLNETTMRATFDKHDVDYDMIASEMNDQNIKHLIDKNFEIIRNLEIQGTPSYVINGMLVPGLLSLDKLKTIILEIRSKAQFNNR